MVLLARTEREARAAWEQLRAARQVALAARADTVERAAVPAAAARRAPAGPERAAAQPLPAAVEARLYSAHEAGPALERLRTRTWTRIKTNL